LWVRSVRTFSNNFLKIYSLPIVKVTFLRKKFFSKKFFRLIDFSFVGLRTTKISAFVLHTFVFEIITLSQVNWSVNIIYDFGQWSGIFYAQFTIRITDEWKYIPANIINF